MRKSISLAMLLGIAVFWLKPLPAATPDEQEILRVEREACDAYLHDDADYLAKFFTEDFVFTSDSDMTDKTKEIAEVRRKEIHYTRFENLEMVVRQHGDTAVVTGITYIEGKPVQGDKFAVQVRFTDSLTRIDGKWRMIATHVSGPTKKDT